jgi:hypothetical protein
MSATNQRLPMLHGLATFDLFLYRQPVRIDKYFNLYALPFSLRTCNVQADSQTTKD